jgi:hypothetical protein
MLVNLNKALTGSTADDKLLSVDKAYSLYEGSIFARATKRAANFETATGELLLSPAGVAHINTAIESGFNALQAAVQQPPSSFDLAAARAAKQVIVSQAQVKPSLQPPPHPPSLLSRLRTRPVR